jgi:hypothetical protein
MKKEDAYKAMEIYKKYIKQKIEFSTAGKVRSHRGILEIDGIIIDIVGDVEFLINNKWVNLFEKRVSAKQEVFVEDTKILVSPLKILLEAYTAMGRDKDTKKIKIIKELLGI